MPAIRIVLIILSIVSAAFAEGPYYVDNAASGSNNGSSWTNAWQSFSAINWTTVAAGSNKTVYISGGSSSKTYNEGLTIGASGTSGTRITVSIGQDAGHTGTATINGGGSRTTGITISGRSYINITGQAGTGTTPKIRVTNHTGTGVSLSGAVTNVDLGYLESDTNGTSSDTHGISAVVNYNTNYNIEIHHCLVHDNYQDALNILQGTTGTATQYGTVRIHHNTLYNINDDGIETSLPLDFYNNEVGPRIASGGRGHPDGIQFYGCYSRVYNNYFHGFVITADPGNSNSNIFFDPFDPDTGGDNPHDVMIYNNLIVEPETPGAGDVHRGIAVKFAEPGVASANNILVANNTIIGTPYFGMSLTFASLSTSNVSNIIVANNIFQNVGRNNPVAFAFEVGNGTITYGSFGESVDVIADRQMVYASSGTYKTAVGFGAGTYTFAGYQSACSCEGGGSVANPLLDGSYVPGVGSPAIGAGYALTSYFTTDKNGNDRGAVFDIGAYEYGAGPPATTRRATGGGTIAGSIH